MTVNLKYLKIPLPSAYDAGQITGWSYKSVAEILYDQVPGEMACLQDWVVDQIKEKLNWVNYNDCRNEGQFLGILELFEKLGIKPTNCIYEEYDDTDELL